MRRIIGGVPVNVGTEHPYVASMHTHDGDFTCMGVAIHRRIVLTAAHCRNIHFVEFETQEGACKTDIIKVIPHPRFGPISLQNDIAILVIAATNCYPQHFPLLHINTETAMDFSTPRQMIVKIQERSVVSQNELPFVIGKGFGSNNSMHMAHLPIRNRTMCDFYHTPPLFSNNICAGGEGVDTCFGDSGTALFLNYSSFRPSVAGLCSFGRTPCGISPAVYTNVTTHLSWIAIEVHDILQPSHHYYLSSETTVLLHLFYFAIPILIYLIIYTICMARNDDRKGTSPMSEML